MHSFILLCHKFWSFILFLSYLTVYLHFSLPASLHASLSYKICTIFRLILIKITVLFSQRYQSVSSKYNSTMFLFKLSTYVHLYMCIVLEVQVFLTSYIYYICWIISVNSLQNCLGNISIFSILPKAVLVSFAKRKLLSSTTVLIRLSHNLFHQGWETCCVLCVSIFVWN